MGTFTDHFGGVARRYVEARPTYPAELFAWLAAQVPDHTRAWDCGCGSGQASVALAEHFDAVIGTDASEAQLAHAASHPRVTYCVAPADASGLDAGSASVVTVAQALHWFPLDAFYAEVRRVARPDALVAAWTYAAFALEEAQADAIVHAYHYDTMAEWWPPEREIVERRYAHLPFPFARVEVPEIHMRTRWSLAQVCAYLRSWSSTSRYVAAHGHDPVDVVESQLHEVWGDPTRALAVDWPLTVMAGRV